MATKTAEPTMDEEKSELIRRQIEETRGLAEETKRRMEEEGKKDREVAFLDVAAIDKYVGGLSTQSTSLYKLSVPGKLRVSKKTLMAIDAKVRTMLEDAAAKAVETQVFHYSRGEIGELKEAWI